MTILLIRSTFWFDETSNEDKPFLHFASYDTNIPAWQFIQKKNYLKNSELYFFLQESQGRLDTPSLLKVQEIL